MSERINDHAGLLGVRGAELQDDAQAVAAGAARAQEVLPEVQAPHGPQGNEVTATRSRRVGNSSRRFRGLAQLVEQRIPNPQVVGSSPPAPAKTRLGSKRTERSKNGHGRGSRESRARSDEAADEADEPTRAPRSRRPRRDEKRRDPHEDAGRARGGGGRQGRRRRARGRRVARSSSATQRFVYAAYMAGAMLVAFLVAKVGHLALVPPRPVEARARRAAATSSCYLVAGLVGVVVALYYWRKPDVAAVRRTRSPRSYEGHLAEPQGGHELHHGRHLLHAVRDRLLRAHGPVLDLRHRQDLQLLIRTMVGRSACDWS